MKSLKVLSLFDGMSCGQIALERAGFKVDKYYASEIDKYGIAVTQKNYPNTIHLGDITAWKDWKIEQPDIIIGGSPCQGFSIAGKQLNFEDERSKLFFVFVEILKHYKPKYFLLENVVMKQEYIDVISGILGELYPECISQHEIFRSGRLEPIKINSALVSAQNRKRLYWTNIQGIEQPEDREIVLRDIIQTNVTPDREKSRPIIASIGRTTTREYFKKNQGQMLPIANVNPSGKGMNGVVYDINSDKAPTVTTNKGEGSKIGIIQKPRGFNNGGVKEDGKCTSITSNSWEHNNHLTISWRKLTPIECERLQTLPDNYTAGVSNSQRYKMLGNGWTVDVIAHIFSYIR